MTVRTRQSYMDLCRSDRPWKGRDMADLVDKIYDVEERADRASKVNATKLVQAKSDGFDVSGEGFLQKREGKWILSEPDFLTEEEANKIYARIRHSHNEYALKRHAPTHHYGGADPLEGQEIHGLRIVDSPTFASITATTCSGIGTRPVVARPAGNLEPQDPATFLGTIGAAPSSHTHPYLPINNPNFTGILYQGGFQRIASDGTGWFQYLNSDALVGSTIRPLVVRADGFFVDQDAATFRGTISAAAAVHDHTSITGSAAKLTTARSIGMTGDGTWSVSFDGSANASGVMTLASIIAAGGPVGSATKAPQFTWDSKGRLTAVDEVTITPAWSSITSKPTTFSGLGVTMLASDIPNHASRHHWNGADPISGQSISGLRTTSSPTFYGIIIGDGGIDLGNLVGIGRNGSGGIYMRPSAGVVRLTVEDTNVYCSTAFSANSGQFTNLSTGFVRSNSVGQLSSSSLLASELPNHASRHHWDGADALAGQSINGLRSTDSPSFLNLNLGGALNFSGYSIITYEGEGFYVETSAGWQLIKSTLAGGTIITAGLFPTGNGIECGKDSYRWNFRSNDLNHDCETITAVNTTPGASILSIPSIGNGFRIVNGSDGSTRNYRVPNGPGAGIMKRIVLFSASVDPTGFTRIYPPSSGQLWNKGYQVTTYIEFGSSAGELKIVMDSDGSNWYI